MALQYLHMEHIVFRGLVPDNLLIDQMGYVRTFD
jgi:serine/threonine protein kinase